MAARAPQTEEPSRPPGLTSEELRWLHDKYERLAAEEGQLAGVRTSYFAAIGTVLVTGLVIAIANLLRTPVLLTLMITFLAMLGILISVAWALLLYRTTEAQMLWREAAVRLEQSASPVPSGLLADIALPSGAKLTIDLSHPFIAHRQRFSREAPISWWDRVNPVRLTEFLPVTFVIIWSAALVLAWVWFLTTR